jgi:hypothetical protein
MVSVTLKVNGDRVSASITDDDNVVSLIPMKTNDAKLLRLWLNGMVVDAPLEVKIGGIDYYFNHQTWKPLRDVINEWYEDYYA